MTYAPTEFEVTTSKGLAVGAFTRKFIIWLDLGVKVTWMLPSTLYIMWPVQLQSLKLLRFTVYEEIHLQENTLFYIDLGMLPSTLYIILTYSATKFEVTTSNGLKGDTFTRNVTHRRTDARTDRRTDFGTKFIYLFFSKEKSGYNEPECQLIAKRILPHRYILKVIFLSSGLQNFFLFQCKAHKMCLRKLPT